MGTKVETVSRCDLCEERHTREGADGDFPPVDWAVAVLSYRLSGSGWSHNRRIEKTLCPQCAERIEGILEER